MRKFVIIIGLVLLALGVGYVTLLAYQAAHKEKGEEVASSVRAMVEEVKRRGGSYPAEIKVPSTKIWGILPGPRVKYHLNDSTCSIYYYQWPLGPHHVLDCRTNEWSFEE